MARDDNNENELTLTPSPSEKPERKRKRSVFAPRIARPSLEQRLESPTPVVRLEAEFHKRYQETWQIPYVPAQSRDRAILNRFLEPWGYDFTLLIVADFMIAVRPSRNGGDPIVNRSRFGNVVDFGYHAEYLAKKRRLGADGDSAGNRRSDSIMHEVAKAMGKSK